MKTDGSDPLQGPSERGSFYGPSLKGTSTVAWPPRRGSEMPLDETKRKRPSFVARGYRTALLVALVAPVSVSSPVKAAFTATLPGGVLTLT